MPTSFHPSRALFIAPLLALFSVAGSALAQEATAPVPVPGQFGETWYRGLAEITTYDLRQARYGEMRDGTATLIFVTEPFSRAKQVKLDDAEAAGADHLPVFKLNATRSYLTGIYPYHVMTSVFVPQPGAPEGPAAIKANLSMQEWCGHVFLQTNRRQNTWQWQWLSYFESEGDGRATTPAALLEDEVLPRLRTAPDSLPVGKLAAAPALHWQRYAHTEPVVVPAEAAWQGAPAEFGPDAVAYVLRFPALGRELRVYLEKTAPFAILGWDEADTGRRRGGEVVTLTTTARKRATIWAPYWSQNRPGNEALRVPLGLSPTAP